MRTANLLFYKLFKNFYGKQLTTKKNMREHYIKFLTEVFGHPAQLETNIIKLSKYYIDTLEALPKSLREEILVLSKKYGLALKELSVFRKVLSSTTKIDSKIANHFDDIENFIEFKFRSDLSVVLKSRR